MLARHLTKAGFSVVGSADLDFAKQCPAKWDVLVTNPPFTKKPVFFQRAYELGKPFALLLPVESLAGQKRIELYRKHGIQVMIPDKRINFSNAGENRNGTSANFPTAWFCWGLNLPDKLTFVQATW